MVRGVMFVHPNLAGLEETRGNFPQTPQGTRGFSTSLRGVSNEETASGAFTLAHIIIGTWKGLQIKFIMIVIHINSNYREICNLDVEDTRQLYGCSGGKRCP
jgi:hypothetical protein